MIKDIMQAVILAAGQSSRFWPLNQRNKSLFKIMGRPLVWYTIESLKKRGIKEIILIQGPQKDIEEELTPCQSGFQRDGTGQGNYNLGVNVKYIVQPEPKGMGDALFQAKDYLKDQFFVLDVARFDCGDYVKMILEKKKKTGAKAILIGAKTNNPQFYGILELEGDKAKNIIEKPEKGKEPSNIKVVGVYLLPKEFLSYYQRVPNGHYSFEDALSLYMKEKEIRVAMAEKESLSLKYPWSLFEITKILMNRYLKKNANKSARIAKNATIEGNVYIGQNTKILENAVIKGPCYIGNNCLIGNNVLIREYVSLEDNTIIGANAEVARCILQKDVHIHSGFFGDSILGENCRIGAGAITANVRLDRGEIKPMVNDKKIETGLDSLGVIMGERSLVGVNVSFMPGVLIGSNCKVGPNSVVFENLEDNTTFYTKFQRVVKKAIS